MIVLLVVAFRLFLKPKRLQAAVAQAKRNVPGSMEGHAAMSMMQLKGTWRHRLASREGWIAISHGFVMNWAMLWRDILIGLLVAGALGAWIPNAAWQSLFPAGHPHAASILGAFLGPLIAVASFTCSVGNVPFAAVLWQGGISFGGVIGFIFGDLIIPPILNIYRKYYGGRMSVFLAVAFYLVMVAAALLVEGLFTILNALPQGERRGFGAEGVSLNYTTVLNIIFGLVSIVLFVAYARTGGPEMMHEMADSDHGVHTHRGTGQ
jgi:hypothetical protein